MFRQANYLENVMIHITKNVLIFIKENFFKFYVFHWEDILINVHPESICCIKRTYHSASVIHVVQIPMRVRAKVDAGCNTGERSAWFKS